MRRTATATLGAFALAHVAFSPHLPATPTRRITTQ